MMATTVLQRFKKRLDAINGGEHCVRPGMPWTFTAAAQAGDCAEQGDVRIIVIDEIPVDFTKVAKLTDADRQLVLGNTQGAKHVLDSLDGVTMYRHTSWGEFNSLLGPCLKLKCDRVITHPVHGDVTVLAGMTVQIRYQREYDKELAAARRARD